MDRERERQRGYLDTKSYRYQQKQTGMEKREMTKREERREKRRERKKSDLMSKKEEREREKKEK
jgi:hypothetical protein